MRTHIIVGQRFHSLSLAKALKGLGEEFTLYSSLPGNRFHPYPTCFVPMLASIGKKLTKISFGRFTEREAKWFGQLAALRLGRPDVVYGWAGYSLESARRAKKNGAVFLLERSCPHLAVQESLVAKQAEALEIQYRSKSESWRLRCLEEYDLADRIVVPSSYTYRSFTDVNFTPEKLFIARLDKPSFVPELSVRDRRATFTVGTLGGNILRKGFQYLFSAWESLALTNAKLLVKADEAQLRHSPVLAGFLDRNPSIEITGYVEDIRDFYRRCDLFCLPSVDDGFGLAALEATACSVPVLITQNVGAADVLAPSKSCWVVPPADSQSIANVIEWAYSNRFDLDGAREMALRRAMQLHDPGQSEYERKVAELYRNFVRPLNQSRHTAQLFSRLSSEMAK